MKLRSPSPFWPLRDGLVFNYPTLRENLSCEIAIVGGGLSGAMLAYHFAEVGIDKIILVDKRDIGTGSTSASTALVTYEIDFMLKDLVRMRGEHFAVQSYRACYESTKKIERIVKKLANECDYMRKSCLFLGKRKSDVSELKEEYETRRNYGFGGDLEYLDQKELESNFSFSRPAGLLSHDAAQLDPYLLTHFLLQYSMKKSRVQVYDRTNITKITEQKTRNGLLLTADNGFEIRAKKIIYATGYESPEYVKKIVKLKSTYAIASEPVSNFEGWGFGQCLIWEHATSYVYARTSTDGRVILGGEDEDFVNPMRRDKMVSAKSSILLKKAKKMFPKMKEDLKIAYGWAGTFGETKDGLPYIGEVRGFPHSYFALCYGANGTNFALIGAETIRDLYLEKLKPSENVFGFRRN